MSKRQLLILSGVSLGLLALGVCVPTISLALTSNIPQAVFASGGVLFLLGCLGSLVAWFSGLIMTAASHQWGWFVAIVLFNTPGALVYALRGSNTSPIAQVGYSIGQPERAAL